MRKLCTLILCILPKTALKNESNISEQYSDVLDERKIKEEKVDKLRLNDCLNLELSQKSDYISLGDFELSQNNSLQDLESWSLNSQDHSKIQTTLQNNSKFSHQPHLQLDNSFSDDSITLTHDETPDEQFSTEISILEMSDSIFES